MSCGPLNWRRCFTHCCRFYHPIKKKVHIKSRALLLDGYHVLTQKVWKSEGGKVGSFAPIMLFSFDCTWICFGNFCFLFAFLRAPYFGFGKWKLIISDIILINGNSWRTQLCMEKPGDDSACKGNRRKEPCQGHFWKESYGGSKNDWEKLQSWCPFSHGRWYAVSWSAHYKRSWLEGWNMWCGTKESDQKKGKKWSKREVSHPCFSSGSHRANSTEWDC